MYECTGRAVENLWQGVLPWAHDGHTDLNCGHGPVIPYNFWPRVGQDGRAAVTASQVVTDKGRLCMKHS